MSEPMTPSMPSQDDSILAAEYVLRVLPSDEEAAFVARLNAEPQLRAEVFGWEARFAALTDDVAEVMPPAHARKALLARVGPDVGRSKGGRMIWGWLSGAVVAMGLAAVVLVPGLVERTTTSGGFDPEMHADLKTSTDVLFIQAGYDAHSGMLRIIREAAQPQADHSMELWLIPKGGQPISLGLMPDEKDAMMPMKADMSDMMMHEGGMIAVTAEPLGGSPSGVPTGEVLASGPLFEV
ncbi:hypothetical protein ERN12_06490 [Rhodobacteraceae bacterium]|nr:hypothetical protein ERN12_06490 [Paracoccaceae bacterium]